MPFQRPCSRCTRCTVHGGTRLEPDLLAVTLVDSGAGIVLDEKATVALQGASPEADKFKDFGTFCMRSLSFSHLYSMSSGHFLSQHAEQLGEELPRSCCWSWHTSGCSSSPRRASEDSRGASWAQVVRCFRRLDMVRSYWIIRSKSCLILSHLVSIEVDLRGFGFRGLKV